MATSTRLMHAQDALPGVTIRARSAPPPLWQVNTCMSAAWTELCMHLHDEAGRGQAPPLLYAPQRTTSVYGRGTPCGCPEAARYAAFLALILCLLTACSGAASG